VAIVQISRITNRIGRTENLPQLAGAEFGWCTDSRRLFIGNGTLQEGAPVIGNTEILTEFSDITVLSDYTYEDIVVGYAAQTGATVSQPVVRSVQAKLDDQASVRDFGAVGDGVADDTAAINRALFQLYCRENNSQIRRSLFFPAGTYRVTQTIVIPSFAKLIGEGADCTIVALFSDGSSTLPAATARYGDSRQQTGVNVGAGGATPPVNIEISSMSFTALVDVTDVFIVESATQCWFDSVNFRGALTTTDIIDSSFNPAVTNTSAVKLLATNNISCVDINFNRCAFSGVTNAVLAEEAAAGVTVTNSAMFSTYYGVVLRNNPTGVRVVHNTFDTIYAEGVLFENVNLNVSAYNVFYNVGNSVGASSPTSPVISMSTDNNVSIGDVFDRSDDASVIRPRIKITSTAAAGAAGGTEFQLGQYNRAQGRLFGLLDNQSAAQTILEVNALEVPAFNMMYTIVRGPKVRIGNLLVVNGPTVDPTSETGFTDDYTENDDVGITLTVVKSGNYIVIRYTSTSTTIDANLTYSISKLA
jgi:hypothetical protein